VLLQVHFLGHAAEKLLLITIAICNFFLLLVHRYAIPFASHLGLLQLFGRNPNFLAGF
jgi:hypothetical protein